MWLFPFDNFNNFNGFALFSFATSHLNQVTLHHFYIIHGTWSIKYMDGKKVKNPIGSFGLFLHHHTITSFLWQWAIHFREGEKKKSKFFFPSLFMWISSVHPSDPFRRYFNLLWRRLSCLFRGARSLQALLATSQWRYCPFSVNG